MKGDCQFNKKNPFRSSSGVYAFLPEGASWFVSMESRYKKLAEYVRGWMNYYGIPEYYRLYQQRLVGI